MDCCDKLKTRGLITQVTNEEETSRLANEDKVTPCTGFDPTADSLHVGRFMTLYLMKRLQDADNKSITLASGGTSVIRDSSGKTDMYSMMTVDRIDKNCESFEHQMSRLIGFGESKARMVSNADWLRNLNYIEFIRDVDPHLSADNMLRAECYEDRMEKGLSFFEFNYMLM